MPNLRRVLRAFLASPGDLDEERRIVREVVDDFNKSWAEFFGYEIVLFGWEESAPSFGRPQEIINENVDRCDLFLGMIWKKWGTVPTHDSTYSSGFEEEFERSVARREQSDRPEIALFFKDVSDDLVADPGDDLKKVIAFREKLITEKKILFRSFSTRRELEKMTRTCIEEYVRSIKTADAASESSDIGTAHNRDEQGPTGDRRDTTESIFSSGFTFLERFADKLRHDIASEDIRSSDVARLRLFANSISRTGNHEMTMGAHDLNIVFSAHKDGVDLSHNEVLCLARLGLQHMTNENVPFWHWYSLLMRMPAPVTDVAIWSTVVNTNDEEKLGAFRVLKALGSEIQVDSDTVTRGRILDEWFSEESSAQVRSAAFSFLAMYGKWDDYRLAKKEYDKNDQATSRDAFECMVMLCLRTGPPHSSQLLVLNSQFASLSPALLSSVLHGFVDLATHDLTIGLEHSNAEVRAACLEALHERSEITPATAERLLRDDDATVRLTAIGVFSEISRKLTESEVRDILVWSKTGARVKPTILGNSESDTKGRDLFEHYRRKNLRSLSEDQLTREINRGLFYDDEAYFVRAERYFSRHATQLRRDVDDRFHKYFEEVVQRITDDRQYGATSDLLARFKSIEDFFRKSHTRMGFDVLCRAGKPDDLGRIRRNFRCRETDNTMEDVEYLRKHGDWTDIGVLVSTETPSLGSTSWWTADYSRYRQVVAKAVLGLSRGHSLSDLFDHKPPASILKEILLQCPDSRFSDVSDSDLIRLFYHEAEAVRRVSSLKAICALPTKRISSILDRYIDGDRNRYYNVIHWLDLGVSMSRKDARRVARAALEQ